jgi:hypothetical protein
MGSRCDPAPSHLRFRVCAFARKMVYRGGAATDDELQRLHL